MVINKWWDIWVLDISIEQIKGSYNILDNPF